MLPRNVYLDHAATTKVHDEIMKTYVDLLNKHFANSDSLYDAGTLVSSLMEKSRKLIAENFHVSSSEILFTSGATEANNMAIKGIAFACMPLKKHIITSNIEHSSVKNALKQLEEVFGFEITRLNVNSDGVVSVDDLKNSLRSDTCLVSILMVNNEVGSIQPISAIAEIVKKQSSAFMHVDAVQAFGKISFDLKNIDVLTISAHKIHGIKGSGVCIKKQHVPLVPIISGGQQEYNLRGGTENAVANIVLAKTIRLAIENQEKLAKHCIKLKDECIRELSKIKEVSINTPLESAPHILNFSTGVPSEIMMNALNKRGICVSALSTCSSKSKAKSDVLLAMNKTEKQALSSVRCSFSLENTSDDVKYLIENIKECICKYGN